MNAAITNWDSFRGLTSLQDQVNRLFEGAFVQGRSGQADLATWAPAVDIYEGQNELVAKVDLPGVEEKDIDIRLETRLSGFARGLKQVLLSTLNPSAIAYRKERNLLEQQGWE